MELKKMTLAREAYVIEIGGHVFPLWDFLRSMLTVLLLYFLGYWAYQAGAAQNAQLSSLSAYLSGQNCIPTNQGNYISWSCASEIAINGTGNLTGIPGKREEFSSSPLYRNNLTPAAPLNG